MFTLYFVAFFVFVFRLSFIFSFILHPSCIAHIFFSFPPSSWLMCTFLGRGNSTSCTFVGGESHRRDVYTKGEKTFFFFLRKPSFVLLYACFLVVLWCFELCLVSMFCFSHHIVFMCWTYVHPYAIVLYWLHVRMIICFAIWSL